MESRVLLSTTIAGWSFSGTQAASTALISPATGTTGVTVINNQGSGTPALTAIGMALGAGTTSNEDILPTASAVFPSFTESTWRLRGAVASFAVTNKALTTNVATLTI